jgi:hypothetical protein
VDGWGRGRGAAEVLIGVGVEVEVEMGLRVRRFIVFFVYSLGFGMGRRLGVCGDIGD